MTGWTEVALADVAQVQGGIQKQGKRRPVTNKHPFLRVANVARGRLVLDDVHEVELFDGELERYRLRRGDLLVVEGNGSADQIGRAAVWDDSIPDCVHQNHLIRVRPKGELLPEYLGLAWNSPMVSAQVRSVAASTSGLYTLSTSKLKSIAIPYCPLDEQRRVVDIVEAHVSHLDQASTLMQQATARLASYRRATLSTVIDRPGRARVTLGELVERIEAGRSFGGSSGPADADQWGIIKVSAMTWGRFKAHENKAVSADLVDPRYEIHSGDLLVSRANTTSYVGASVLVDDVRPRLLLSDKSLRLIPAESTDPRWLQLALSSPSARAQISSKATGTKDSMRNVSQSSLLSIMIPQADAREQAADVARLMEHHETSQQLQVGLASAGHRQEALRRALFKAAFAGRLTGHTEDADPVEDLATMGTTS